MLYSEEQELWEKQGKRCAICGSAESRTRRAVGMHVDHSEERRSIRGILCAVCNTGLVSWLDQWSVDEVDEKAWSILNYLAYYDD